MVAALKVLSICGSLRKASFNRGLLRIARTHLPEGVEMSEANLDALPMFNQDLETAELYPAAATELRAAIKEADALLIACPEYNSNVTPLLSNAIGWGEQCSFRVLSSALPLRAALCSSKLPSDSFLTPLPRQPSAQRFSWKAGRHHRRRRLLQHRTCARRAAPYGE